VAVQHGQIQVSLSGSLGPLADRRPGHVVRLGHLRHRSALPELGNGGEDVFDIIGLSRQNIAGKDALSRLAGITAAKPDPDSAVPFAGLQAPLHPGIGQDDRRAAARGANTSGENVVIRARQNKAVSGRVYFQYVRQHVPRRPRLV